MNYSINKIIMQEMGLEVGRGNRIYDQDTQEKIKLNGIDVVEQGYGNRGCIEFDPYNNRKMAGQLFDYFLGKVYNETGEDVIAYYNLGNNTCGNVVCKLSSGRTIESSVYYRDSLKYADIMMQLNGEECPNDVLKDFDVPYINETVKKRRGKDNGTNTKTAKNSK